ncbi:MAG: hypothetical protein LBU65_08410 [Planctomycetaceae bacterium]|jgi:hypothetical protein|nr:hypothetical protein [Planctomycetaceae bacterium]
MTALQIPDFPNDLLDAVALTAQQNRLSVEQQMIKCIRLGLKEDKTVKIGGNRERRRKAMERSRVRVVPEDAKSVDVNQWIREDRD